jgi:DNA (cytosine-5-)-methyltransferase
MEPKVIELFAGVGGFRVGLNKIKEIDKTGKAIEEDKWKFVWANQWEPSTKKQHAYGCYVERFGDDEIANEDITKVDKKTIPNATLLVGGFPCQDYSVANVQTDKGITGKKGVLFWDIAEILREKEFPFVLLENVDRLLKSPSKEKGRDFSIILKVFDELGYNVEWKVINAENYGMPQRRKRVFIFAYKRGLKYENTFKENKESIFEKTFPHIRVKEYVRNVREYDIEKLSSEEYTDGKYQDFGYMENGIVSSFEVEDEKEEVYTLGKLLEDVNSKNVEDYIVKDEQLERWKYLKSAKVIEKTLKDGFKFIHREGAVSFPSRLDISARTLLTSAGTCSRTSHIIYDKNINKYRVLTPEECEAIQMFPVEWTKSLPKGKRYFAMGNALVTGIVERLSDVLLEIIEKE